MVFDPLYCSAATEAIVCVFTRCYVMLLVMRREKGKIFFSLPSAIFTKKVNFLCSISAEKKLQQSAVTMKIK